MSQVERLPTLPHGYLGKQQRFDEFGLQCVSHADPVIHLDVNTVTITLKQVEPMRVTANLIAVDSDEEFPDFVFSNRWNHLNILFLCVIEFATAFSLSMEEKFNKKKIFLLEWFFYFDEI